MVDERTEAALERAQEILQRQPTPEELAASEARRQRLQSAKPATYDLADLQYRWRTSTLTDEEFYAMKQLEEEERARQILKPTAPEPQAPAVVRKVQENALMTAPARPRTVSRAMIDALLDAVAEHFARRDAAIARLERRIVQIEKETKPRHRVRAISERTA